MHRPPAVAWDLVPTRWQSRAPAVLVLLAAMAWGGFLLKQGWGPFSLTLLLVLIAAAVLATVERGHISKGQLRWDGEHWHWSGEQDRMVRSMACVMDLQSMVLLYIRCDQGKSHWLWLEAGRKPHHWKALRRAIVASKTLTLDDVITQPRQD
jgi:hypothetical protein